MSVAPGPTFPPPPGMVWISRVLAAGRTGRTHSVVLRMGLPGWLGSRPAWAVAWALLGSRPGAVTATHPQPATATASHSQPVTTTAPEFAKMPSRKTTQCKNKHAVQNKTCFQGILTHTFFHQRPRCWNGLPLLETCNSIWKTPAHL